MNDVSILHAVDLAFGSHLSSALSAIDPSSQSKMFANFLNRPTDKQIYRGEKDTPTDFLRAVVGLRKEMSKQAGGADTFNQATLPLLGYFRSPGFSTADPSQISRFDGVLGYDDNFFRSYDISVSRLSLDYQITLIASEKSTLDAMALAIHFFISNTSSGGDNFDVVYRLFGDDFSVRCMIDDPKTFSAAPASSMADGGRIFALSVTYTVFAHALYGKAVELPESIGFSGLGVDHAI